MMETKKGSATADLLWVLAIVAALWILWFATGGTKREAAMGGPFIEPPAPIGTGEIYSVKGGNRVTTGGTGSKPPANPNQSSFADQVTLGGGNARSESTPNREYITITARSNNKSPVNITGWRLFNSVARHGRISIVTLGTPISLAPGGVVTINTGYPPASNQWTAGSAFQLNKCSGYLAEDFADFRMTPSLPRQCPKPVSELGVIDLPEECYDYVKRISSCHTPEFKRDGDGYETIDGRRTTLSSQCRTFLANHYSYNACLAWHRLDEDFLTKNWRIFLNQTWELWAKDREVISLYDAAGKLVDEVKY
ncbi:MAG: hypothetical protein AAB455_03495 [Patescibacteria group bacterium]|mgnify:CR=1 FL=1